MWEKKKVLDDEQMATLRAEITEQVKADLEADFSKKFADHSHVGTDFREAGSVSVPPDDPEEIFYRSHKDQQRYVRLTILRAKLENNDLVATQMNREEKTDEWTADRARVLYARFLLDVPFIQGCAIELSRQSAKEVWATKWLNMQRNGQLEERGPRATSPTDIANVRVAVGNSLKDQAWKMEVFEDSLKEFIKANQVYIDLLEQK